MELEDGGKIHGTSHVLSGDIPIEEAVLHTEYEQGDLLPNEENVVNPTMLLEGEEFRTLLDTMAKEYRYVFVDVPPLGVVSDGEKIGSMCDGAVLVVRAGKTTKAQVRNSLALLQRAGCPLLGVVLNRVGNTKKDYYYYRDERKRPRVTGKTS
jgi:capsular exopolysaccharide synthesis family protein